MINKNGAVNLSIERMYNVLFFINQKKLLMNITKHIFSLLILFSQFLLADLASPTPFIVTQPNGVEIEISIKGNFRQAWHEYNGWTITKNQNDWWVYADGNRGTELTASTIRVGVDNEPSISQTHINRGIRPNPFVLEDNAPIPNLNSTRSDTFLIPWILVEFPDANATYEPSEMEPILNQEGYTHLNYANTGSFRDFYQEVSYGQFLPVSNVSGWVTAPHEHDYYAYSNPNGYQNVRQLVRDMVDSLEAQGFDWSIFDNDNDGYVDALNLIHQGPGAEEGDQSNIWSHKWSLGNLAVQYDGVIISSYTMNPEIQNGNIVAIGVLAHEFGHALGLPDLYDTDYSSTGAGKLALMASGSWGTSGNSPWHPASMIGWCKNRLGWVNVVELNEDQNNVSVQQSYSNNTIYRVNHSQVSSEYWLIENRQKVGTDTLMPSPGFTFWHINDNIASGWGPNNNEPYYGVGLEQADGMFALENGGPSNGGDVYPGDTDNREFSHASSPNTTSLYGEPSMVRIDNISDPDEFMTFDLTYGEIILGTATISNGEGYANNQGSLSLSLDNPVEIGSFEFELNFNPSAPEIINVNPTERVTFDSVIVNNNSVQLVNPVISPGTGAILDLTLFNYTGVGTNVNVTYDYCLAFTTDGDEVGITSTDDADYTIHAMDQVFSIEDGNGSVNGGASYTVSLNNTVGLSLAIFQLGHSPSLLSPSDEPFEDSNGNNVYDEGEIFIDWNENGVWSPAIEFIDLDAQWTADISGSGSTVTIALSNWTEPLAPGNHEIFRVNCAVDESAELNDEIAVFTNGIMLMDEWGHEGVPFINGDGLVTLNTILSTSGKSTSPSTFAIHQVYPNPFNPQTTISFSIIESGETTVKIFDISGRLVDTLIDQQIESGYHQLKWHPNHIASGLYFVELQSEHQREIQKLTFLK